MWNNKAFLTFNDSPAFKYFSHWLPDDGLIDALDASIDFESDIDEFRNMVIKNVAVTFFPHHRMQELKYKDHPLRHEQWATYQGYSHSGVASLCDVDGRWMKSGNVMPPPRLADETGSCLGYSPDGDFAWLRYYGFANIDYARQAIEQFAFIRECEWARDGSLDPEILVKPLSVRKREGRINTHKNKIRSEETRRCAERFESEIKRRFSSGEMWCPKNVDVCFNWPASVCGHVAETNPGSLEFREQWETLRKKMIQECESRVKKRESRILL